MNKQNIYKGKRMQYLVMEEKGKTKTKKLSSVKQGMNSLQESNECQNLLRIFHHS